MIPLPAQCHVDLPPGEVPVDLRRLFPQASFVGAAGIVVGHTTDRSSDCRPGSAFAVIRGLADDGARHIAEAICHGATALLTDRPHPGVQIPQCIVADVRQAYAELCAARAAHPARRLLLTGVTGTNGKTTTTWLVRSILQAAGQQTGLLGTIEYSDGVNTAPARLTTPDPATLSQWLASMVAHRTTCAALEVSSHALVQQRLAGTGLDAAVITNITQDHFDYHGTYEAYRLAKLKIFDCLKPAGFAIVNLDDPGARSCLPEAPQRLLTFSLRQPADVTGEIVEETAWGTRFRLQMRGRTEFARTPLVGRHNVSNCLAAAAAALCFEVDPTLIVRGLSRLAAVPGRVERLDLGQPFPVFVDYAHTPDALGRVLDALRPLATGRLICVFGAGGDRDRGKRPLMGQAVALRADLPIVTSDNPRGEDPLQIIDQIVAGMGGSPRRLFVEPDRQAAIRWALQHAGPDDVVVIAGKGHESEQVIGTTRHHFDDREVARECLLQMHVDSPLSDAPHRLGKPLSV